MFFHVAFHPQIDGQIEKVNGVLNQYFKKYANIDQRDWGEQLQGLAKFCYNSTTHSMIKMSPFKLALVKETKKPMDLAIPMGQKEVMERVQGCEKLHLSYKTLGTT